MCGVLWGSFQAYAEDFYVIKIKGSVEVDAKLLKQGDKLSTGSVIVFGTPESKVIVVSTKRGQLILKPDVGEQKDELALKLSSFIVPENKYLATRGVITNELEFIDYLSKPLVLIDTMEIRLLGEGFIMNQDAFYFLQYTYLGERISKQISSKEDSGLVLQIIKDDVLKVDGVAISDRSIADISFMYYDKTANEQRVIKNEVQIVFVDTALLQKELTIFSTYLPKNDNLNDAVKEYILQEYGIIESNQLHGVLTKLGNE